MWDLIDYLKEPALVAAIQDRFGVKEKSNNNKRRDDERLGSVESDGRTETASKGHREEYIIENKFWYYLFFIGTSLGDEIFYASFIPFWFWNIDGAVGRRVVSVWTIVMCVGQGIKEIIKWPRPSYPAKRLQKKWAEEYGMPSTHAMVAVSIPFSVLIFTINRYIYSAGLGIFFATVWCVVICVSRVYFGMHTVLDIIVGLLLAFVLMLPMVPMVDYIDSFWLSAAYSPLILFLVSAAAIYYFPNPGHWTPTRSDTTMITSVWAGIHIGTWTNFNLGNLTPYPYPPPYKILWPNYYGLSLGLVRTIIGFTLVLVTRNVAKSLATTVLSTLLNTTRDAVNAKSGNKKPKDTFVQLAATYATYFMVGFNTVYWIPMFFRYLAIERPTFYTEI